MKIEEFDVKPVKQKAVEILEGDVVVYHPSCGFMDIRFGDGGVLDSVVCDHKPNVGDYILISDGCNECIGIEAFYDRFDQ